MNDRDDDEKRIAGFIPVGADGGVGHMLNPKSPNCPNCGSPPTKHEVQNYDETWRDGDVVCTVCGTRVRGYDAG